MRGLYNSVQHLITVSLDTIQNNFIFVIFRKVIDTSVLKQNFSTNKNTVSIDQFESSIRIKNYSNRHHKQIDVNKQKEESRIKF